MCLPAGTDRLFQQLNFIGDKMSKYKHLEVEQKHQKKWAEEQTYKYFSDSDKQTFVIDTPPPTVSGSLHIGHIFSYTQTDILARFHRMQGKNVFYPMGWDDNGLPTEKRAQKLYAVQCDPKKDYDPHFKAKKTTDKKAIYKSISRRNFLEICAVQVLEDEAKYKKLWNHIALSVDWSQTYQTISPYAQSLAQVSFLDLYKKNLVENRLSPVLWDTQFQTAVAQADVENREKQGFYHNIVFKTESEEEFVISTTRPELLPACVAITAHPEDERYKKLFGQKALSPLFYKKIPVLPSPHTDPKKGTGILMICTFGDMEDAAFCLKHSLPVGQLIDEQGFFIDINFNKGFFKSEKVSEAKANYSHLIGLRVWQARKKIVEILKQKSFLKAEPKECLQNVRFYEKGDFPLEILLKRQWYVKILDHKEELLHQGQKIHWHPPSMRKRYERWVEGLNQDWCISRQRVYGVPFPVWYGLDFKGQRDYSRVIVPKKESLFADPLGQAHYPDKLSYKTSSLIAKSSWPIDPLKQSPEGLKEEQRDKAGGWTAETDVMDTWATSSLTPYINSGWIFDKLKHKKLFPADLRPQAHEIIRTWAFYTMAKAYFHDKQIPWKNIAVSGWVLTPDKMKMSKSKGNALTPENLIKNYSADALRYWAAKAKLGQDSLYDENLFKTGKKLVTKIFNAGLFTFIQVKNSPWINLKNHLKEITTPLDKSWIKSLLQTKAQAIDQLQNYKHSLALESIEKGFWLFCDNYLELVKARVYQLKDQPEGLSARRALDCSLYIFLKLFAPYLPYVTEELWQSRYLKESSSLHNSTWLGKSVLDKTMSSLERSIKNERKQIRNQNKAGRFSPILTKPAYFLALVTGGVRKQRKNISSMSDDSSSLLENAFFILEQARNQKSKQNKSLASSLKRLEITASSKHLKEFELYKEDIARASHVDPKNIVLIKKNHRAKITVQIELA